MEYIVLQYNLSNRKTVQSYKLNYFIKQQVIIILNKERLLEAVQYLCSMNFESLSLLQSIS